MRLRGRLVRARPRRTGGKPRRPRTSSGRGRMTPRSSAPSLRRAETKARVWPPPGGLTSPPSSSPTVEAAPGAPKIDDATSHPLCVGKYRVRGVLGVGAFGWVYKAYDHDLERDVAVKVPHPHVIATPEDVARVPPRGPEPRQARPPQHRPRLRRRADGGRALLHRLEVHRGERPGSSDEVEAPAPLAASEIVAALADALHSAHHAPIGRLVHRDIKPRNILVDLAGKPYLTDFGLACVQEDFGTGPTFAGTFAYMSPEAARAKGTWWTAAQTSSAWAWSIYELLTGVRPFRGCHVDGGGGEDQEPGA